MTTDVIQLPPQDIEVERAVLSACMIGDPDAIDAVCALLTPESFYLTAHRHIFNAILALQERGEPADQITVRVELERMDKLEEVGGVVEVAKLAGEVGTSANVEYHALIIRDLHIKRGLALRAQTLRDACFNHHDTVEDLQRQVRDLDIPATGVVQASPLRPTWELAGDSIGSVLESIRRRQGSSEAGGVATKLTDLDNILDGLQPSDSIIVAGRPSVGKTALGLAIAWNVAGKLPVGFISVEMTTYALNARLLAMTAGLNSHYLRRGRLGPEQAEKVGEAAAQIKKRPLFISETLREPGHILREAGQLHREHGIGLLVIDYLQLLDSPSSDIRQSSRNREQEVSAISRAIKALAKELRIPVLTLAQLSRAPERREGKRPILSDLRESGSIEQDADVVILLSRPVMNGDSEIDGQDVTHLLEANVAKQRNGPRETVNLYFDESTGKVANWGGEHGCAPF